MNLRELALKVAQLTQDAGHHALQSQLNPHDLLISSIPKTQSKLGSGIDRRLVDFIENRLGYLQPFSGTWKNRPKRNKPGERFWCVGAVDGAINFIRNMPEWTITVSLFEFVTADHAHPILGVVHAPALGVTYLAAEGEGAIRIRHTSMGDQQQLIMPSTTQRLNGSVVSFGMSRVPEESERVFRVLSRISGKPTDIKRVGPVSLDLCKVADGTYDAYFEPHLHSWDIPAVSAGTVVVRQARGKVGQWKSDTIHWRGENDIVASNGLVIDELKPHLTAESSVSQHTTDMQ